MKRAHGSVVTAHKNGNDPEARPAILATGPLTSDALATSLEALVGRKHLAYYDAIAPILAADSIDWSKVWKQSRWGKGITPADVAGAADAVEGGEPAAHDEGDRDGDRDAEATGDGAYVHCPPGEEP